MGAIFRYPCQKRQLDIPGLFAQAEAEDVVSRNANKPRHKQPSTAI